MRQAGRYMAEFRAYSDKYPFRYVPIHSHSNPFLHESPSPPLTPLLPPSYCSMRSETTDIAVELSMQPWRAFKPDGVIMFSDILTPLPALVRHPSPPDPPPPPHRHFRPSRSPTLALTRSRVSSSTSSKARAPSFPTRSGPCRRSNP